MTTWFEDEGETNLNPLEEFIYNYEPAGESASKRFRELLQAAINFENSNKMKYELKDYLEMAEKFNKMNFSNKIIWLRDNPELAMLASDHNWWRVKLVDKEMEEDLEELGVEFKINKEWDSSEIDDLISIIGIKNVDYD